MKFRLNFEIMLWNKHGYFNKCQIQILKEFYFFRNAFSIINTQCKCNIRILSENQEIYKISYWIILHECSKTEFLKLFVLWKQFILKADNSNNFSIIYLWPYNTTLQVYIGLFYSFTILFTNTFYMKVCSNQT